MAVYGSVACDVMSVRRDRGHDKLRGIPWERKNTVHKMLVTSVPPGYRREAPRSTAKRIFVRLREDHGFDCGQTIVNDHVRERRRRTREMFVPLSHPPGHAQVDFTPCERKRFFLPVEGELVDCPPTGFNSRPTAWFKVHANEVQNARLIEHDLGWEALREVDPEIRKVGYGGGLRLEVEEEADVEEWFPSPAHGGV